MDNKSLQSLRQKIDQISNEILRLLNERAEVARQIGTAKQGGPVYLPAREAQVLDALARQNNGPLPDESVRAVFAEIIAACRNLERRLYVAYLGPEGTYSEQAARKHLGNSCKFLPFESFEQAARATENTEADVAVIAIENSTEGSVAVSHDLLLSTSLQICGEIHLPVHHQLLSHSSEISNIKEVFGHPQALGQCRKWLTLHLSNAKQTTAGSNAEAAKLAAEHPNTAAVAGKRAAEIYNLNTLAQNIEDEKTNTTRFLVLGKNTPAPTHANKTSVVFCVPNRPGALLQTLQILADNDISMTRLESHPSKNSLWEYVFFIDFLGHQQDDNVRQAFAEIRKIAAFVKILGSYPVAR